MKIVFRKFYPVMRPMIPMAVLGCVFAAITAFAQITLLAVSGWFIAAMALAGAAGAAINYFSPAAIIRGLSITRTAGRYAERLSTHDAALRFVAALRPWIFSRISAMSTQSHDRLHSGYRFDLLRGDIDYIEKVYLNGLIPLIVAGVGILSASGLLFFYVPFLGLLLLIVLSFCGVFIPYSIWRVKRGAARLAAENGAKLRVSAVDMIDGLGEMLVYGRAVDRLGNLADEQEKFIDMRKTLQVAEAKGAALQGFCIAASAFSFLAMGIVLYESSAVVAFDVALLVALPLLIIGCAETLSSVTSAFNACESAAGALERMAGIMDVIEPEPDNSPAVAIDGLVLSDVSFRYSGASVDTLENISFSLAPGEMLAISGASGSGKSTLIDIIAGVYTPTAGSVGGGGLARTAVAEQRPYVFAGTLHSNLAFGQPHATEAEMDHVCDVADMKGVISGFKDGYNTRLGTDGVAHLSGGQMRRLSVARALLKKADFLLLDEPDDGLYPLQVMRLMENVMLECTVRGQGLIVVTHNMSVINMFSRVLYLESGRLVDDPIEGDMIYFS
jgi:ATP-binding cassette subfamily C protein CydC